MKKVPKTKEKGRLLSPKQEAFLSYYTDPKSDTFGNALRSGLKAGYTQEYSESITTKGIDWLADNVGDMKRIQKAEKNLLEVQELSIVDSEGKVDAQIVDKRTKVDMFVLERLNKAKYSVRNEHTGADGKDLIPETLTTEDKERLKNLLNGAVLKENEGSTG